MLLTTNTVKFIIYVLLCFNCLFALDYLILSNNDLKESANIISDIYSDPSKDYFLDTEIVIIDTLSMEIKDFIDTKIETNSTLKYLLIIGDENNFPGLAKSVNCEGSADEYPSDDFFSSVDENNPPRLSAGRIPAKNLEQALSFAHKLENYIANSSYGYWKNRILLISDDEIKNNSSIQNENHHTIYSDSIYQKLSP